MGRPPKGKDMEPVTMRLPAALLARVDAVTEQLQKATPWSQVTRGDAYRALLTEALDARERRKR
jgi:hypothetical protein